MDMMDIYVSPDDDECDSTNVAAKCNPHRVVWLKCKATAEKAMHIAKLPPREMPPDPNLHDNSNKATAEKATAEKALHIAKLPPREMPPDHNLHDNLHDNSNKLQKTPLIIADRDREQDKSPIKRDNNVTMASTNEPQFEHTRVNMETVDTLDMNDRDPTDMNKHVRVWFGDVLAEPEGMHSFDGVWRSSFVTFTSVKFWSYRICTLLCGIPFSICWGVYFACLTFLHIWYVVPCIKSCLIVLHWASKLWTLCIRTFCDPCYESVARIFSSIHVSSYRQ